MSDDTPGQRWLDAGIKAWREGEQALAHDWLSRAVLEDEHNALAWWWLAAVSTDRAEQKRCLENVLALDPGHEGARQALLRVNRGLAPDEPSQPAVSPPADEAGYHEVVVRKEIDPVSPAAAMLYPERSVREWRYKERPIEVTPPPLGTAAESTWDDVWSRESPLCAYCAAEIQATDGRCPSCRRPLRYRQFRYAEPSSHLTILFVIVLGFSQLFFVQALYAFVFQREIAHAVVAGLLGAVFVVLAVAVVLRWSWVHTPLLIGLGLVIAFLLLRPLVPFELALLSLPGLDPAIAAVARPLPGAVAAIMRILQVGTAAIGLLYAIWFAAPDFEKETIRREATLVRGLSAADQYDATARRLAGAGMWGAAIVHWQRAVAMEPVRVQFQRGLAEAYARLGFRKRALDVLRTSLTLARDPGVRQELEALQAQIAGRGGRQRGPA